MGIRITSKTWRAPLQLIDSWLPSPACPYKTRKPLRTDLFVAPLIGGRRPRDWQEIRHLLLAVEVLSPSTALAAPRRPADRALLPGGGPWCELKCGWGHAFLLRSAAMLGGPHGALLCESSAQQGITSDSYDSRTSRIGSEGS